MQSMQMQSIYRNLIFLLPSFQFSFVETLQQPKLLSNPQITNEKKKKNKRIKKDYKIYIYISQRVIYYSRTIESIVPASNVINIKILSPIKPSLMHGNGRRWSVKRQLSTLVRSIKDDNTWKLALFRGFTRLSGHGIISTVGK